MLFRKFVRDFQRVVDRQDCDCDAKLSAHQLVSRQAGQWDIWFYKPRSKDEVAEMHAEADTPVLRIFPQPDLAEEVLRAGQK